MVQNNPNFYCSHYFAELSVDQDEIWLLECTGLAKVFPFVVGGFFWDGGRGAVYLLVFEK